MLQKKCEGCLRIAGKSCSGYTDPYYQWQKAGGCPAFTTDKAEYEMHINRAKEYARLKEKERSSQLSEQSAEE